MYAPKITNNSETGQLIPFPTRTLPTRIPTLPTRTLILPTRTFVPYQLVLYVL